MNTLIRQAEQHTHAGHCTGVWCGVTGPVCWRKSEIGRAIKQAYPPVHKQWALVSPPTGHWGDWEEDMGELKFGWWSSGGGKGQQLP